MLLTFLNCTAYYYNSIISKCPGCVSLTQAYNMSTCSASVHEMTVA